MSWSEIITLVCAAVSLGASHAALGIAARNARLIKRREREQKTDLYGRYVRQNSRDVGEISIGKAGELRFDGEPVFCERQIDFCGEWCVLLDHALSRYPDQSMFVCPCSPEIVRCGKPVKNERNGGAE